MIMMISFLCNHITTNYLLSTVQAVNSSCIAPHVHHILHHLSNTAFECGSLFRPSEMHSCSSSLPKSPPLISPQVSNVCCIHHHQQVLTLVPGGSISAFITHQTSLCTNRYILHIFHIFIVRFSILYLRFLTFLDLLFFLSLLCLLFCTQTQIPCM